jgi:hypothetical protein
MTREFRVWDKVEKKYVKEVDGYGLYISLDGDVKINEYGDMNTFFNRFVLEQFTGLYDKNGNKIFEGDMITCDDVIYEVYYAESGFKAMISIDGETFGGEYDLDSLSPVEIIGNVHEEVFYND